MFAWVQALLGRPIEDGEEIDLDNLTGTECLLDITHKQTEQGTFERIAGVRQVRKKRDEDEPQYQGRDRRDHGSFLRSRR